MKRPAFSIGLTILVAVLSLGLTACSGLPGLTSLAKLTNKSHTTPSTALFVPKQSPLVASAMVSPQQQAQILFDSDSAGGSRQGQARFLGTSGITYAKDIQSWVGDEVTFAVTTTDFDRDRSNGQQPGYLLALTVENIQKSQAFLPLLWQKRAVPSDLLQVETYQGVTLTYQEDDLSPASPAQNPKSRDPFQSLATAQVGDRYILIANHPKVLRDAINNAQAPDLSLSSTTSYQNAVKVLSDQQWGWVFMNLPEFSQWSHLGGDSQPIVASSDGLPNYRFDKLAIALRSQRGGLAVDTLLLAAPEQTVDAFTPNLSRESPVLNYLPAKSVVGIAGTDLSSLWPALKMGFQGYPVFLNLLQQPQLAFEEHAKTILFDKVLNWVKGDYGLAMVPTTKPAQPDWVFVAERSPEIEGALAHLNDLAQKQGYTVVDVPLEEQSVTTWTQLQASGSSANSGSDRSELETQVGAVHTTVGDYELFATSVDAMKAALLASKGQSLRDAVSYQKAIAPLSSPNAGHFYFEWKPARPVLEKAVPLLKWINWGVPSLFKDFKTVTLSGSPSDAGMRRNLLWVQAS